MSDDDAAELTMRSGEIYDVAGYSDDVGARIHVLDASLGEIDLKWDRIEEHIQLESAEDVYIEVRTQRGNAWTVDARRFRQRALARIATAFSTARFGAGRFLKRLE